jgi:hypothetical protein
MCGTAQLPPSLLSKGEKSGEKVASEENIFLYRTHETSQERKASEIYSVLPICSSNGIQCSNFRTIYGI